MGGKNKKAWLLLSASWIFLLSFPWLIFFGSNIPSSISTFWAALLVLLLHSQTHKEPRCHYIISSLSPARKPFHQGQRPQRLARCPTHVCSLLYWESRCASTFTLAALGPSQAFLRLAASVPTWGLPLAAPLLTSPRRPLCSVWLFT